MMSRSLALMLGLPVLLLLPFAEPILAAPVVEAPVMAGPAPLARASAAAVEASATCGPGGTAMTPSQVVDAQFRAYNDRHLDAFLACYAPDATMTDLSGTTPPIKGADGFRKAFAYLAKPHDGPTVELIGRVVNGPTVIDRERPLIEADGKPLPDIIAVYEVREGKIVNAWFPPGR